MTLLINRYYLSTEKFNNAGAGGGIGYHDENDDSFRHGLILDYGDGYGSGSGSGLTVGSGIGSGFGNGFNTGKNGDIVI